MTKAVAAGKHPLVLTKDKTESLASSLPQRAHPYEDGWDRDKELVYKLGGEQALIPPGIKWAVRRKRAPGIPLTSRIWLEIRLQQVRPNSRRDLGRQSFLISVLQLSVHRSGRGSWGEREGPHSQRHPRPCTSPGPTTSVTSRITHLALVWPFSCFWAGESRQGREQRWREGQSSAVETLLLSYPSPCRLLPLNETTSSSVTSQNSSSHSLSLNSRTGDPSTWGWLQGKAVGYFTKSYAVSTIKCCDF